MTRMGILLVLLSIASSATSAQEPVIISGRVVGRRCDRCAIRCLPPDEWQIADVLDALVPGAARVTVKEAQVASTDLIVFRR